jgi:hypothetical protein
MNIRILIHLIWVCAFITKLISCQNENNSLSSQQSIMVPGKKLDSTQVVVKAIQFPKNVEILLPTQYRKETTGYPENIKEKEWFEIYKDTKTNQWQIDKAELKISYGRDECVGEDVMIIRSNQENPVMFFTPFDGLSKNPTKILENKALLPERNVKFNFKGIEYQFLPMGTCLDENEQMMTASDVKAKKEEDLIDNTKISGYRLSFGAVGNMKEIVVKESIEYSTPRVIWAGDLNNDNLPDFILDLPDFYESRHLFFFLSDKYDKEKSLKKAAELWIINDC